MELAIKFTLYSSQVTGSENQVSSTTTSGVRDLLLRITEAIEDVMITLLMVATFAHDLSRLTVPFTAGSINSD